MKKILALALVVLMFAQTCVFASELPFFDKDYLTYEETVTYSAKINKPINLNFADEYLPAYVTNMIDINGLINGLFNSTSTVTGKADISPDYKSGKIYAGGLSAVPVYVNKNLKITADANTEVWLEYDFSDLSKPVFNMIQNTPSFDKYVVYDIDTLIKNIDGAEPDAVCAVISKLLSKEFIEQYRTAFVDLLTKYADIKKDGKGYTITIDDKGFKAILNESVTNIGNFIEDFVVSGNYATKEEFRAVYDGEIMPYVISFLEGLQTTKIIGDGNIVMKVECDNKGYIKKSDTSMNICVNIFEIIEKLGGDVSAYNLNDGILDFTLNFKSEVKKLSNVKVDFPVLNEENSVNFADLFPVYPDFEPDDGEWHQHFMWGAMNHDGLPVVLNGEFYPHLRDMAVGIGFADGDITYENGIVTLMRPDWVECGKYKTASFAVGSNTVYLDGEAYTVANPALEVDDEVVISNELAKLLFRITQNLGGYVTVDFVGKSYWTDFDYQICDCDINEIYGEIDSDLDYEIDPDFSYGA